MAFARVLDAVRTGHRCSKRKSRAEISMAGPTPGSGWRTDWTDRC